MKFAIFKKDSIKNKLEPNSTSLLSTFNFTPMTSNWMYKKKS